MTCSRRRTNARIIAHKTAVPKTEQKKTTTTRSIYSIEELKAADTFATTIGVAERAFKLMDAMLGGKRIRARYQYDVIPCTTPS
jgi:hypothetical protein